MKANREIAARYLHVSVDYDWLIPALQTRGAMVQRPGERCLPQRSLRLGNRRQVFVRDAPASSAPAGIHSIPTGSSRDHGASINGRRSSLPSQNPKAASRSFLPHANLPSHRKRLCRTDTRRAYFAIPDPNSVVNEAWPGFYLGAGLTRNRTPSRLCRKLTTAKRLSARGFPLGPNMRIKLLDGIFVASASSIKPTVALM